MTDLNVGNLITTLTVDADGAPQAVASFIASITAAEPRAQQAGQQVGEGVVAGMTGVLPRGVQAGIDRALSTLPGQAGQAGQEAGRRAGIGFGDAALPGIRDGIVGGIEEAEPAARQAAGQAGESAGAEMLGRIAGAVTAAAVGAIFLQAFDLEAANNKLKAQLDLTTAEAEHAGALAGQMWADNYGEGIEDVNEAIRTVTTNLGRFAALTDDELTDATKSVLNLADAFGVDLAAAARTVGTLVRTGMAKDFDEASDLITKGLQSPVNAADDLLDTFDEYSTVFRTLGLDGRDALGLLQQGLQGGARDADVIADSFKELLLRVQAGDAAGGLRAIGLDAKQMADDISQGGEVARRATAEIVAAYTGIGDQAVKSSIGVELFGTKAEDAQMALNGLDLATAGAEFEALNGKIEGAAARMDDALGDGRKAAFESLKRGLSQAGTAAADMFSPAVDEAMKIAGGVGEVIGDTIGFLDRMPGPLKAVGAAFGVATVAAWAFTKVPVVATVTAVVAAIGWLASSNDGAAEAEQRHADEIDALTQSLDTNTGAFTENTKARFYNKYSDETWRGMERLGLKTNDYTEAVLGNAEALARVEKVADSAIESQMAAAAATSQAADLFAEAGIAVEDVAKAYRTGDYTAVEKAMEAVGYSFVEAADGVLRLEKDSNGALVNIADMNGKGRDLRDTYRSLTTDMAAAAQAQEDWNTEARATGKAAQGVADDFLKIGDAANPTAKAVTAVDLSKLGDDADEASEPLTVLAAALQESADAASDADQAVKYFNLTVNEMLGINTTAEEATKLLNDEIRSARKAMEEATEATKGNIESLINYRGEIDTTTEAGSKLYDELQGMGDAYDVVTTAAYNQAVAEGNVSGALDAARKAADNARARFMEQAAALKINASDAEVLATNLGIVEGQKLTDKNFSVNAQGLVDAKNDLDLLEKRLVELDGKTISVYANQINNGGAAGSGVGYAPGKAGGGDLDAAPGPKGVDSMIFRGAKGEHVFTAEEVDKLGGHGKVYALRQAIRRGDIPGFANGGALGRQVAGINLTGNPAATYGMRETNVRAALIEFGQIVSDAAAAMAASKADANRAYNTWSDAQASGDPKRIATAKAALDVADRKYAADKAAHQQAERLYRSQERNRTQLVSLSRQWDNTTSRLEGARSKLADLQATAADLAGSIASTIAGTGGGLLGFTDQRQSVASILSGQEFNLRNVRAFEANLRKVEGLGLSSAQLTELASAGVEGAGATAAVLATASKAQIARLNELDAAINKSAASTGKFVANDVFGASVSRQEKLVADLVRDQEATRKKLDKLGADVKAAAQTGVRDGVAAALKPATAQAVFLMAQQGAQQAGRR